MDTETDGLKVFGPSVPVGLSVSTTPEDGWYIPWGHAEGFNFDFENVKAWAKDNLRDKQIELANAKFDLQMLRKVGIDIEAAGNKVRDIAHRAALLNSKRQSYRLDALAEQYLNRRKVVLPFPHNQIALHDSSLVYDYAVSDTQLTIGCADVMDVDIERENLGLVRDLEDDLIYVTCHMERNGALIDRPKLEMWQLECRQRMNTIFWKLAREAGFRVEPTNPRSVAKLCDSLKIEVPRIEGTGNVSVKNEWLQRQQHPLLNLVYQYRKLSDLDSDYLTKYLKSLDSNNYIRYNLNQLKSDKYGTVTGRYSASGDDDPESDEKVNIQQVVQADDGKASDPCIADFPIRELFLPGPGYKWIKADASQLQFRIFAHYSEDRRIINEYCNNRSADFHNFVLNEVFKGILGEGKKGRSIAKTFNFGQLFGMGIHKIAASLGIPIEEAKRYSTIYHSNFPAAKRLNRDITQLARHPEDGPDEYTGKIGRGYIRTISKRRRRYSRGENLNSAMNAVIQGTEADIVKDKLLLIYENREWLGGDFNMIFTVHDEADNRVQTEYAEEAAYKLEELLNDNSSFEQRYGVKFKVPIYWDIEVGDSWHM